MHLISFSQNKSGKICSKAGCLKCIKPVLADTFNNLKSRRHFVSTKIDYFSYVFINSEAQTTPQTLLNKRKMGIFNLRQKQPHWKF